MSNDRQLPINQLQHSFMQPAQPSAQSPWLPQETVTFRRPGPFDPPHPTSSNTIVVPSASVSQGRAISSTLANEQSPWMPAQSAIGTAWSTDPSSLTVANLGQHNQQHEALLPMQPSPAEVSPAKLEHELTQVTPPAVEAPPAQEPTDDTSRPAQKLRRKSAAQPAPTQTTHIAPAPVPAPAPLVPAKPPSPPPPAEPKAAWGVVDDSQKARPAGAPLNLREIQEAEARKLEARKTAERERERAARAAAAAAPPEEFQSFTTTWGLPTSQVGAARTPASVKESPVLSSTTASSPNTPAWTNTAKAPVAKKSVKEIQEEEERRKKQALKEKETVAAAARRAYAETTTKV